ncbi:hypothetical protein V2J09_004049 [Rumex salicifolius]
MFLLGYEEGSKAYRPFDPEKNKVAISRDVKFEETEKFKWNSKETQNDSLPTFSICPRLKLSKSELDDSEADATIFRSIIGSLRYLVNTRLDLSFSVGVLSRFMENPKVSHMEALKRILRYVKGTLQFGCVYKKDPSYTEVMGYSDSDLAGDIDDRKSTSGVVYFLGKSPITWVSRKQRVVALSSCEAEYIAATAGACRDIWLKSIMETLQGKRISEVVLKIDNKSTIALAKNPVFHDRSKHIDTKFHFIRDCVKQGKIKVDYVSTNDQLGDLMTKPLARQRFSELRQKIGVKCVNQA